MINVQEKLAQVVSLVKDLKRPPLIMGVLNVTPDSFHDGGKYHDLQQAIKHGIDLHNQGADIIDIGGESTRPGAEEVPVEEELKRVIPVVQALAEKGMIISIDTRKAVVAREALSAGAIIVNDVSGFRYDPQMIDVLLEKRPIAIAMHMRGQPSDMQKRTFYHSLIPDILSELWSQITLLCDRNFPIELIWIDPGIGFAKTAEQCMEILRDLDIFVRTSRPVVVGVSRKSFIGKILGYEKTEDRLFGTAGAVAVATWKGARVLRVHDVKPMRDVVRIVHAISALEG